MCVCRARTSANQQFLISESDARIALSAQGTGHHGIGQAWRQLTALGLEGARKRPRCEARPVHREETPRKGRDVRDERYGHAAMANMAGGVALLAAMLPHDPAARIAAISVPYACMLDGPTSPCPWPCTRKTCSSTSADGLLNISRRRSSPTPTANCARKCCSLGFSAHQA